jgi:hypothetical protein
MKLQTMFEVSDLHRIGMRLIGLAGHDASIGHDGPIGCKLNTKVKIYELMELGSQT